MALKTYSKATASSKRPRTDSTPSAPSYLNPLTLGETRLLLMGNKVLQISLEHARSEKFSSHDQERYNSVQKEVTDLIAAVLQLEAQGKPTPPLVVFEGSSYTLTCHRSDWSRMRSRWEWKLNGQELEGNEAKIRFVFAEKVKEER